MRTGIILCSRIDSERLPKKVFRRINGISVINRLLFQLSKLGCPIVVAVPREQYMDYLHEIDPSIKDAVIFASDENLDPLARMNEAAKHFSLDRVIRITHDKIFVDVEQIGESLRVFNSSRAEYLYLPDMIPGTGFEILSAKCIHDASQKFKNVEHISYAARMVSKNTIRLTSGRGVPPFPLNLLIDFAEDLDILEVICSQIKKTGGLTEVLKYLSANPEIAEINRPPLVTIYSCAYNASPYIEQAMDSIREQTVFKNAELILIDDHSMDDTCAKIARFALGKTNVRWYRNEKNVGLASSSNIALKKARGKYIIRLDADDFFVRNSSVQDMIDYAEKSGIEALYPDNHFGSFNKVQKGSEKNHVGGTLFDKRAINFIKFTDGLQNYEGLDLFRRAKDKLKIGYYEKPTFFYRQHSASMSKTNLEERERTKKMIEGGNSV